MPLKWLWEKGINALLMTPTTFMNANAESDPSERRAGEKDNRVLQPKA